MKLSRVLMLLRKDLRLGPRSPVFLWALVMPLVMTLLVQVVFGSLFEPTPRLGVVDAGNSAITAALSAREGIELVLLNDASELKRRVEAHDLDGGLVLEAGFDEAVRAGEKPLLEFYLSGESLASHRVVLAVTTLDLVREVEGRTAPVEIEIVRTGDGEALPLSKRLVPLLVLFPLIVAGVFLPSFSLVEERERKTLDAMLVTPVRLNEVLLAKAALGLLLSLLMAIVTLALNGALAGQPAGLLLALLVGAVMSVEIGLVYGAASRDTKSLYALFKSLNLFLLAPVLFYLFPDWPQWIARVFPTYWFLDPIFQVTLGGASLGEVAGDLLVALAICAALVPVVLLLSRRMQAQLAST
jgi:ABC-2 type transport system permease protein